MDNVHTRPIREDIDQDVLLSAIAEGSTDAITRINIEGTIVSWSPGAERMFGYSHDEIVGKPLQVLLPEDRIDEEYERICSQISGGIGLIHEETVRLRKNGKPFSVQMTRLPLKNSEGKTIALLSVLKDITKEKELKAKLQNLARDTAMAKVAAKVAHEIRTPLGVLFLKSDLLVERLHRVFQNWGIGDPEEHKQAIEKLGTDIQKQISRLEEIANNYLHLSKSRSMEMTEVDIARFMRDTVHELKEQYSDDAIEWSLEVDDCLPGVWIDSQKLQRVFSNLVRNSIEALRSRDDRTRQIGFHVDRHENTIRMKIWDNGPGIPNDIIQTVFDPFTTTKSIGTGLGLYLVQEIMHNHGGAICVDSEEDKGTTIHLSIPVERKERS